MVNKPGDITYSLSTRFGGRGLGGQNNRRQFPNRTVLENSLYFAIHPSHKPVNHLH